MCKGLTLTLVAVLMAVAALQAQAEAPIISGMPDIIVGDVEGPTSNTFVFPVAVNLNDQVSDADTADSALLWSFVDAAGTYKVNGVASLNLATEDPLAPGVKAINVADTDPRASDTLVETITVRNATLSPIGGANTDPVTTGILPTYTSTVTFYVTDADNLDSATVMIYTDNDGADRLSGGSAFVPVDSWDFVTEGATGWTVVPPLGSGVNNMTAGLCVTVGATGTNRGGFRSAYGLIELSANSLYKLHLSMSCTNTAPNTDPVFDVIIENTGGTNSVYAYGNDYWFIDNRGGANNVATTGGQYDLYFTPAPITVDAFETYLNTPANDGKLDARLVFRVLDYDSSGVGSETRQGTICLNVAELTKASLDSVVKGTPIYTKTSWTGVDGTDWTIKKPVWSPVASTITTGDAITISPVSAVTSGKYAVVFYPGLGRTVATTAANFPMAWEDQSLYMMEIDMSASGGTPVNFMDLIQETGSLEFFSESYVIGGAGLIAMPTAGGVTYVNFMNGHNLGSISNPAEARIRAHGYAGADTAVGAGTYSGTLTIDEIRVYKATIE